MHTGSRFTTGLTSSVVHWPGRTLHSPLPDARSPPSSQHWRRYEKSLAFYGPGHVKRRGAGSGGSSLVCSLGSSSPLDIQSLRPGVNFASSGHTEGQATPLSWPGVFGAGPDGGHGVMLRGHGLLTGSLRHYFPRRSLPQNIHSLARASAVVLTWLGQYIN